MPYTPAFVCALLLAAITPAHGLAGENSGLAARPLAPKSGPRGRTMFAVLPPAQTGIVTDNPYSDPKMWAEHYQEYALGSMGTGVALGDFDHDDRPDVFVVSKTGQGRLFRNLGGWKFEDVTEKAGLMEKADGWLAGIAGRNTGGPTAGDLEHWKHGAVFADVNNDGWLDLYVCRFNAPNLLYVNQRDGTFVEEAEKRGVAMVDGSVAGAFCDYDRDGWLDLFVVTNMQDTVKHPDGQPDRLFHNNGDGTFADATARAGISGRTLAHTAIWWDYDADGWPDLYVSNDFAGPDALYRNNRDGTFRNVINEVVPHTPESAMGADFGDINNDGRVDLMVADMASSTHEKDQRGMAVSRELTKEDAGGPEVPQYQRNALYVNTGTGHMLEAAHLAGFPATDWTWALRFEDLDNDGRLDLLVTNGMSREYQNADLRQRIMTAERLADRMSIMRASPMQRDQNFGFHNLGQLEFEDASAAWGLNQAGVSFGAALGDLDGDGDLDVIYSNFEAGVTVLRNDSDQGHRLTVALHGVRSNRYGVGAVVRIETAAGVQVRPIAVLRGYLSSSEPMAHFGLGDDAVAKRLTVEWPSGAIQTFTAVAADQKVTITEPAAAGAASSGTREPAAGAQPAEKTRATWFEPVGPALQLVQSARETFNDAGRAQPLVPVRFNHRGPALAVGDVNGDAQADLVLGGTGKDPTRVLIRDGQGPYVSADISALVGPSTLPEGPVLVFDADGDGHNDLLLTKAGETSAAGSPDYQPHLVLGGQGGSLRPAPPDALPPLPISVGALAAADFNHDGLLDVFVGGRVVPGKYPLPAQSALLLNRGGRFEDVTATIAPALADVGLVSSAVWTDLDGDGWVDLVLALEWGRVAYFHNEEGRSFSDWTEKAGFAAAGTGWWTSLVSADFNGDGRPDIVAGNAGLNTPYQATPERPTLLFYGDFGAKGGPLALEAYYEGDKIFPRRTRNDLGAKIPSVKQRYRRNDLYARSTLADIVGEPALKAALRFAAIELRSGIFLSQRDGTYRFSPLPRLAQIAPAQGMVAADFDGDGALDLALVQNSFAPIAWVGHFDGGIGQVLRGDGHGQFVPVEPLDSNLIVPGDAKALVAIDLNDDAWPDLVASRNNASTLAFQTLPSPGSHALRIDLRGSRGNPTAIGARATLEFNDGRTQTREVAAGGSYYSQSSPACFFAWPGWATPKRVTIRWPGGGSSAHTVAPGATHLELVEGR